MLISIGAISYSSLHIFERTLTNRSEVEPSQVTGYLCIAFQFVQTFCWLESFTFQSLRVGRLLPIYMCMFETTMSSAVYLLSSSHIDKYFMTDHRDSICCIPESSTPHFLQFRWHHCRPSYTAAWIQAAIPVITTQLPVPPTNSLKTSIAVVSLSKIFTATIPVTTLRSNK